MSKSAFFRLPVLFTLVAGGLIAQYPGQSPTPPPTPYPTSVPSRVTIRDPTKLPRPKRKSKNGQDNSAELNLAWVDGVLQGLAGDTLVLDAPTRGLLKFTIVEKTEFQGTKGESIDRTKLRRGDQISIGVHPEHAETALLVALGKPAAHRVDNPPVEQKVARIPTKEDFEEPSEAQPEPPHITPTASDSEIIAAAWPAQSAPSGFVVEQVTTRYFSASDPADWRQLDVITTEVSRAAGKESSRNLTVNGKPVYGPVERSSAWTTAPYGTTPEEALAANLHRRGEEQLENRWTWVFGFSVPRAESHWTIVTPDGRSFAPAYEGTIWIDQETKRLIRIQQHAGALPSDFPYARVAAQTDYGLIHLAGETHLLPVRMESESCINGSSACTRNTTVFRDYRPLP